MLGREGKGSKDRERKRGRDSERKQEGNFELGPSGFLGRLLHPTGFFSNPVQ